MSEQTRWNGEPASCRIVRVVVGAAPRPTWWCASLAGSKREAVEVTYRGSTFFLDNEDGSGWRKVTAGEGSWISPHRSLPVESVIEERTGQLR